MPGLYLIQPFAAKDDLNVPELAIKVALCSYLRVKILFQKQSIDLQLSNEQVSN